MKQIVAKYPSSASMMAQIEFTKTQLFNGQQLTKQKGLTLGWSD